MGKEPCNDGATSAYQATTVPTRLTGLGLLVLEFSYHVTFEELLHGTLIQRMRN